LKLVKRSSGASDPGAEEPQQQEKGGRKPVIVYIMILFIVAFILMGVSFIMHQRSNNEAIGKLENSVSTLQQVQSAEDKNLQLQQQLDEANSSNEDLKKQLSDAQDEASAAEKQAKAMLGLYTLQQEYAAQDYDGCKSTIASMEKDGLDKLLPADAQDGVTSPAQRYLQLREAVSAK